MAFSPIWQQLQVIKKGTRVGCPQVQDKFLGFLRPRTPDLCLSRQEQSVSRQKRSLFTRLLHQAAL